LKAIGKKLKKNSRGFSLAETLICILILLMVSAIVGAAIPTASNVFAKTVDAANAQVVLSTAMTALRDELGTATQVKYDSTEGALIYKSSNFGWCKLKFGTFNVPVGSASSSGGDTPVSGDTPASPKTVAVTGIMVTYGTLEFNEDTKEYEVEFPTEAEAAAQGKQRLLVSKEAITSNLRLECSSVAASNGEVTFTGLQVTKNAVALAQRDSFTVKTVIAKTIE